MSQEVELLVGLEPGKQERPLLGRRQGGRDDPRVALARQTLDTPLDEVARRRRGVGNRRQVRGPRASPPRQHTGAFGSDFDHCGIARAHHGTPEDMGEALFEGGVPAS